MTCPYCDSKLIKMLGFTYIYCKEPNHYYEYSYHGERLILSNLNISFFYSTKLVQTTVYNKITLPYMDENIIYECNFNLIEKLSKEIENTKDFINFFNKIAIFS